MTQNVLIHRKENNHLYIHKSFEISFFLLVIKKMKKIENFKTFYYL